MWPSGPTTGATSLIPRVRRPARAPTRPSTLRVAERSTASSVVWPATSPAPSFTPRSRTPTRVFAAALRARPGRRIAQESARIWGQTARAAAPAVVSVARARLARTAHASNRVSDGGLPKEKGEPRWVRPFDLVPAGGSSSRQSGQCCYLCTSAMAATAPGPWHIMHCSGWLLAASRVP